MKTWNITEAQNGEMRGDRLHPDDRAHVLQAFVHRMTTETRRQFPDFAARMIQGGYRMKEQTDAEWLSTTFFRVRVTDGRLDRRCRYCRNTHNQTEARQ